MKNNNNRLLIISEKIMPYRCDFYREVARQYSGRVDILFLDSWGYEERYDPTFNAKYSWDKNVLDGLNYKILKNIRFTNATYTGADKTNIEYKLKYVGNIITIIRNFIGYINFHIISEIKNSKHQKAVVETYNSLPCIIAIVLLKIYGKKVYLRGEMSERYDSSFVKESFKCLYLKPLFYLFEGFFYSYTKSKEYLKKFTSNQNMIFVPSSVHAGFKSPKLKTDIYSEYSLDINCFYFIGVGRLVERKNWSELIKAFKIASKINNKIKLILIGGGPEEKKLSELIHKYKLQSKVKITGFVDQNTVKDYLKIAGCQVQTSLYDPGPKAINEGLVNNLPIIISDKCGLANDACIHNYNSFVYEYGDIESLASYLLKLSSDTNTRSKFKKNNQEILKTWSLQNSAKLFIDGLEPL